MPEANDIPRLDNLGFDVFERMAEYQIRLAARLQRSCAVLEKAEVPYAVVGGNAVGAWVSSIDPAAARSTRDVDLLISRKDFAQAAKALEEAGFIHRQVVGIDIFLDGTEATASESLHIIFAGERVRPEYETPAPTTDEKVKSTNGYYVPTLDALVRMKLTSFRLKDQVHLQDLANVGLINESFLDKYPPALSARLKQILDNPESQGPQY